MQRRLASGVAVVAAALIAAAIAQGGELRAIEDRAQTSVVLLALPMIGSDTSARFSIGAPNSAGTTCTRLGSFRNGEGWSNTFGVEPEPFTFPSGERQEFAWRFPFSITPSRGSLEPVRAWLNLRYESTIAFGSQEGQIVSRVGGVVPTPAPGGGWVVDEFVRQPVQLPETMEVQACIQWSSDSTVEVRLLQQQAAYEVEVSRATALLASWQPRAGRVALGDEPILERPGVDGLLNLPAGLTTLPNPLKPAGSLSLQAFPAALPSTPTVRTDAVYFGTAPQRTTVTFELMSAAGGFEPTISCETPAGPRQFQLPYRVFPGVPVPFVLHFSSPALSPNADTGDFTCEQTAIKGALGTPPQGALLVSVEDVLYNRETREMETLVGIYNPSAAPVPLAGWAVSAALYVDEQILGFQDEGLDSLTLAAGEYQHVVVRQPAALVGYDPVAVSDAFSRTSGMGSLRVIAGVFRK